LYITPDLPTHQAMDMACWGLIPRFWIKDKGFKEDDAIWGEQKVVWPKALHCTALHCPAQIVGAEAGPPATELREGAFVATILCDAREEEMEENMEQVIVALEIQDILAQRGFLLAAQYNGVMANTTGLAGLASACKM
jgi:hypothetical protein